MSEHHITLDWQRHTPDFELRSYNRDHTATFKNGEKVGMSSAAAYRGNAEKVDPEEMLVASLSSCHMLTFLAIAAGKKFIVDSYVDKAVGHLEKNEQGKNAITRVELRPKITFADGHAPDAHALEELHHKAHEECFIANSVTTKVTVVSPEPQHA